MESFSLLKYWRSNNGGGATTKTVTPYFSDGEDGPYFDLEFTLSDEEEEEEKLAQSSENETESGTEDSSEDENEEEEEVKFTLATSESTDEQNVTLSPSDELFFKGDLVTIEPSSVLLNETEENSNFRVSLLKSATKIRVLLLKLKKSKPANGVLEKTEKTEVNNGQESKIEEKQSITEKTESNNGKDSNFQEKQSKFFTIKLKVDEVKIPLVSLFTRDNSSKQNNNTKESKPEQDLEISNSSVLDEKKLTKEVVQKYLKMVKPLYVRVSKRYVEKLKFTGNLNLTGGGSKSGGGGVTPASEKEVKGSQKQGNNNNNNNNLQAGFKAVRKHLGKSRSASATLGAPPPQGSVAPERRDDSLVQLQDGIQGAILHCKKSFNSTRDGEASSILCRSVSDPSHEKSVIIPTVSPAAKSPLSGEAKEIN